MKLTRKLPVNLFAVKNKLTNELYLFEDENSLSETEKNAEEFIECILSGREKETPQVVKIKIREDIGAFKVKVRVPKVTEEVV